MSFREEFAFALEDNLRGRTTIEILALNDAMNWSNSDEKRSSRFD